MGSSAPGVLDRRRIIVSDEDPAFGTFVVDTLRQDGYAVFHALDGLSAIQLAVALDMCHLVMSDTRIAGVPEIGMFAELQQLRPGLPVVYIANVGRSTPELEAQLPADVPILREPFTAEELRAVARAQLRDDRPLH
jgi:DNA-binding NtrC family response regulator